MVIRFDETTGYGYIMKPVYGSVADKAGLKEGDQILSVDGQKFKGKEQTDLMRSIRGEVGMDVTLKVLREDQILTYKIKREVIPWEPGQFEMVDQDVALLTIDFFNEKTSSMVEGWVKELNKRGVKKMIVDVRGNGGGALEQAIKVSELFLPKDATIVVTKDRNGNSHRAQSMRNVLQGTPEIVTLVNSETSSGTELFVVALMEHRNAKVVGMPTFGKWNVQTVETLPNQFAIQFTVKEFHSSKGKSYQNVGIRPDLEVALADEIDPRELRLRYSMSRRLDEDLQLKAAVKLIGVH